MSSTPANANGHRRRELRARVLAEEARCALCGGHVDKARGMTPGAHGPRCKGNCNGCIPDDQRGEVDEDLPRARGGSPYDRANTHLMHRACNRAKGTRTIAEHHAHLANARQADTVTNLIAW